MVYTKSALEAVMLRGWTGKCAKEGVIDNRFA